MINFMGGMAVASMYPASRIVAINSSVFQLVIMHKRLDILMSVKPEANVLHHPVQGYNMHFNPYIYILYFQSNSLNYLPPKIHQLSL